MLQKPAPGLVSAFVVALLAASAGAQERQVITVQAGPDMPMPPGAQREIKTGTGRIRGRVLSAENGQPVRRVQVRISGQNIAPKTMVTNADGRYEFAELPAGRFIVSAMKSGFMTVQFGQTRPFESGKPIELVEAQVVDKADITLPRGSVIAGRIVDEFGEPITDAIVTAMRSVWSAGRRRLQPAGRIGQTNDLGHYRIYGLPPGDYYVSATFRATEGMMIEVAPPAMSGGTGSPTSGYAATYFPGTTSAADAQRVRLGLGQEISGTDFPLSPVKLARVSGSVMRSDGQPASGTLVTLMPRTTESMSMFSLMDRGGRTDRNGNFTISGVIPGDYTLQARGMTVTTITSGAGDQVMYTTRVGGPEGAGAPEAEFGSMPLTVAGEDVTNVVIVTMRGATATGRLSFDGAAQPASVTGTRVTAISADNEPMMVFPGAPGQSPGSVQADSTFELRGLAGLRLIRVQGLPPGWLLKSVTVEGQDVTDTGFDFKPGAAVTGVDVVVTNRATEINGTVTTSNGRPLKDFTVVVFADDPARWVLPQTRYVAGARPDQEGRVKVSNLPAGDYHAVAVEYLPQGEWGDPEVLDRLKNKATRITLNEGETKAIVLKVQQQ